MDINKTFMDWLMETGQTIRAFAIKHWLKGTITVIFIGVVELSRDVFLSSELDKKDGSLIFLSYILLMIIVHYLEKNTIYSRIELIHYPKSFAVVKNKILPEYIERSKSKSFKVQNQKRDRIIKSPIDYTYETLTGNEAPIFRPNDPYLEEIFDTDVTHIISLTSENPNMWLDPTLNFFFVNTLAVSLIRKFNENDKHILAIKDFKNLNGYKNYVKRETSDLLNKLINKQKPTQFEFIRFFLYKGEQEECLKETIFPSLKASQDLFRLNSFFINKDNLPSSLNKTDIENYKNYIVLLWDRIKKVNHINDEDSDSYKRITKRIEEQIPEFLVLFKSNDIIIHTYVDSVAYRTVLENKSENGINYYDTLTNLVSLLAKYRNTKNECDWVPRETEYLLNSKKSYIDWE